MTVMYPCACQVCECDSKVAEKGSVCSLCRVGTHQKEIPMDKKPDSTIDTLPTCPYCGYVENDYYEIGDGEWSCPKCGKLSIITIHTSFQLEPTGD